MAEQLQVTNQDNTSVECGGRSSYTAPLPLIAPLTSAFLEAYSEHFALTSRRLLMRT